jgi:uncharacterized protein
MRLLPVFLLAMTTLGAVADMRLPEAVKERNTTAVRALLDKKVDVNVPGPDGATALHWAVYLDDIETARLLIDAGANVNALNRYGLTPLSLACTNGNAAIVDLLLKAGADPNGQTPEGETVLMTAARTGDLITVNLLLARGADVNKKEGWRGQTALMWAAAEGHVAVVDQLIESGADIRVRSNGGFTPFLFAVREGRMGVVRSLLKAGADVNESLAPRSRRTTGANEFSRPEGGSSALDLAVSNAHFELAAMLLDAGADPNASGPGWTPLHTITWVRKPGTGSNAPSPPGSGNMDSLELVRKLVAKGANVNARMTRRSSAGAHVLNVIGATPFLMAARTADAELMRLLAQLGADPLATNADGSTALMIAAGLGTRSPTEDAGTEEEVIEAIKVALELGNDINAIDKNRETAMHGAAYKHLPNVVKFLAANGAKVEVWNRKNKSGWTPLRIATGVHRTGNFRLSDATAGAIREVMLKAGVTPVLDPETRPSAWTAQ